MEKFGVSKRTAERMIEKVGIVFTQIEDFTVDGKEKHWRLPSGMVNRFISVDAQELAELEIAIKHAEHNNMSRQVDILKRLYLKISNLQKGNLKRKTATDLEALIEAEGFALRPGPRPQVAPAVLEKLREAMLKCCQVDLHYVSRTYGSESVQPVCPYGFLYGNRRHYLVAFNLNEQVNAFRLFSLSNIKNVTLTQTPFERDEGFSLQAYAERSFGVYQGEKAYNVVWKFSPKAAVDAREFMFHPTQIFEELEDGSLIVRLCASGRLEMDWHLYTWGDEVEDLTRYE
ncbi:MAG: WYL domain-containing protein [Colwellia sp.]|nr:WYL domain-containing protein [Colwellia sp.]